MHPALFLMLIPALALTLAPRWWVQRVMARHDAEEDQTRSAHELARELLDQHGLYEVDVELTDLGDHYDAKTRAVRLSRHHFDRRSLAAITTAAHEVAHALQHATAYPPFEWRARLVRVAQLTGQIGTVLIVVVPASYMLARRPLPPALLGSAVLGMLGTGAAAQLAALPTEFDASFRRALPMLGEHGVDEQQLADAHRILFACSLTYVASSVAGMLNVWPWLGRGRIALRATPPLAWPGLSAQPDASLDKRSAGPKFRPTIAIEAPSAARDTFAVPSSPGSLRGGRFEANLRRVAKPLIRRLLSLV